MKKKFIAASVLAAISLALLVGLGVFVWSRETEVEQLIDEAFIKVESFRIRRSIAVGKNARPRDREAISFRTQGFHQLNVALVEMVVVVRDVASGVVNDLAGSV